MKALLILPFLFLAFSNLSTAQLLALSSNSSHQDHFQTKTISSKSVSKISIVRNQETIKEHNKSAAVQLSNHLAKQLKYSSLMQENCLEGTIVIEVNLSQTGKISNTKVIRSPHALMDRSILEAMEDLKFIKTDHNVYYGNKRIRVPVKFSMR